MWREQTKNLNIMNFKTFLQFAVNFLLVLKYSGYSIRNVQNINCNKFVKISHIREFLWFSHDGKSRFTNSQCVLDESELCREVL